MVMTEDNPSRLHIAQRMADIEPFRVMELLARAQRLEAEGRSIIHMEIGEPDFTTPEPVLEAARKAIDAGQTHYTPALGLTALREAIARYYLTRYNVTVDPECIVITPGASGALLLALGVLLDPGDKVLLADPGYPCNRHFVRFVEGKALAVAVGADTHYQLTADQVERHWDAQTVAAMVASPSNPTGTVLERAEMAAMVQAVAAKGGSLIVDEIYHGLVYEGDVTTALDISDELFVINSFSKYFCMTGWRLGWLVVPRPYLRQVEKLAQNLFIAAPTLSQHAALAAFQEGNMAILEQRREAFRRRRDFLLPALRELGFDIPVIPQGAFYLYANSSRFGGDSRQLAMDLLEQAGVAATPGLDFGDNRPQHYLRFAYTTSMENLEEGVRRIENYLAGLTEKSAP